MAHTKQPLVIISTRLPVSVSKVDGKLVFSASSGGLATAVGSVSDPKKSLWIGWPGIASDDLTTTERKRIQTELKKHGCYPIFLTQEQIDSYYLGYCNATLWPLFHYFPNKSVFNHQYWTMYQEVNALFAAATQKLITADATVWVHDYQLMLLPALLRKKHKQATIGFFLHIPFPSFEILRLLPEREALLDGLLGADLVGFHTYDYVRHFLSSVLRLRGYENSLGAIQYEDRTIQTDAFPIGIDYKRFSKTAKKWSVKKIAKSFNLPSKKTRVIVAVDRTDYSKGIPSRLDAFQLFLREHPEYIEKVTLVILAVPSREGIEAYDDIRQRIEQKISRINGEFATASWSPITYRHQSLPFEELSALYSLADVMLVTPLRDGMNLVAKEFVATKHKKDGVLVLSEMAGVATELPEALLVNPNDTPSVARAIHAALAMPKKQQHARMRAMQSRIADYTAQKWAEDFLTELSTASQKQQQPKIINQTTQKQLLSAYTKAGSRLILLDYDGTLKQFVAKPDANLARPSKRVQRLLKTLAKDKRNTVVIISGRPKNILSSYFSGINLGLIAEHGGWVFETGSWIKSSVTSRKWKKQVKPILQQYTNRTPGARIEEKDFSIVWHYRGVSADLAYVRKQELRNALRAVLDLDTIEVFDGNKILEIKPKRMQKGALVTEMITGKTWDFIMAIGDDYTDEDMFEVLPERAYTIHVGLDETKATHQLSNVPAVLTLLEKLAKTTH